jgi:hypothetical protein
MAKSVCAKNVDNLLRKVARGKCSAAVARRDWNAKSAVGDDCAMIGGIRAEKKIGRQAL